MDPGSVLPAIRSRERRWERDTPGIFNFAGGGYAAVGVWAITEEEQHYRFHNCFSRNPAAAWVVECGEAIVVNEVDGEQRQDALQEWQVAVMCSPMQRAETAVVRNGMLQ